MTNRNRKPTNLDGLIEQLETDLKHLDTDSDAYSQTADQLVKLYKVKDTQSPPQISRDTLALIAGNLAGIVLILSYERANVVTSKAAGFIMKLR